MRSLNGIASIIRAWAAALPGTAVRAVRRIPPITWARAGLFVVVFLAFALTAWPPAGWEEEA